MSEVRRTWLQMAVVAIVLVALYLNSLLAYLQQRYPAVDLPDVGELLLQPSTEYRAVAGALWKDWAAFVAGPDAMLRLALMEVLGTPTPRAGLPEVEVMLNPPLVEPVAPSVPVVEVAESAAPAVLPTTPLPAAPAPSRPAVAPGQNVPPALAEAAGRNAGRSSGKVATADDLAPYLTTDERFLFVGDSLMQGVAPSIRRVLCGQLKRSCEDLSKPSTGLSHKGFHDWPAVVKEKFAANRYTAIFVFMGANDPWDFVDRKRRIRFDSDEWAEVYGQRVADILRTAAESGAEVYWIGLPNMRPTRLARGMVVQNRIFATLVGQAGGVFIDTRGLVDDGTAVFSRAIRLPDGRELVVRHEDGVHFTIAGQQRIGAAVLQRVVEHRRQRAAPTLAPVAAGEMPS